MLSIRQALPDARLSDYVRSYVQRESGPVDEQYVEPVVARLGTMLEFQFDRPFEVPIYGTTHSITAPQINVIGPMTQRTYKLLIHDHLQAFTVLFQPQGFFAMFGVPTSMFVDKGIEGHSVLGQSVTELFEQLGNAKSFEERVPLIDAFLLRSLRNNRPLDNIHHALRCLIAPGPPTKVWDAAVLAGVTARQIERKSLDYVGVSPKMVVRLARFQRALRMKIASAASWSHVAQTSGYHDQMHMIRDFRRFAGENPTQVLEQVAADHLISL